MSSLDEILREINENHPNRSSIENKDKFTQYAKGKLESFGYETKEEFGECKFLKFLRMDYDNLETVNDNYDYIITAHYDTPKLHFLKVIWNLLCDFNPFLNYFKDEPKKVKITKYIWCSFIISLPLLFLSIVGLSFLNIILLITLLLVVTGVFDYFKNKGNTYYNNTSSMAAIMYIAKELSNRGLKDRVKFILFDNGTLGFLGSRGRYIKDKDEFKNKVIINLDSISFGDTLVVSCMNKLHLHDRSIRTLLDNLKHEFKKDTDMKIEVYNQYTESDYRNFKDSKSISLTFYKSSIINKYIPSAYFRKNENIHIEKINKVINAIVYSSYKVNFRKKVG